jgi:ferredoxin
MKNWVGIVAGEGKRSVHRSLAENIAQLARAVPPHLVITDGIVGMEGNGPGDGDPFRLGRIVASDSAVLNDLAVARLIGLDWASVPYLREAFAAGDFDLATASSIRALPVVRPVRAAPSRPRSAVVADRFPRLKRAVRPITDRPAVLAGAKRLGLVQDVYDPEDDTVVAVHRAAERCGDCRRCEDVCPDGLPLDRIGVQDCTGCLYCWWVCPNDALSLEGDLGFLARHAERYKRAIEQL